MTVGRNGKLVSGYSEKFLPRWVRGLARKGMTVNEICKEIGISAPTLYKYMEEHPELREALNVGKDAADAAVEDSLYNRAIGYRYKEVKTIEVKDKDGKIEKIRTETSDKELPPDTTACIWWLKNRRPQEWRDSPVVDVDEKTLDAVSKILGGVKSAIE